MSYLLKALEKAELERKQNSVSPEVKQTTLVVSKGLPKSVVFVLVVAVLLMFWKLIPEVHESNAQSMAAIEIPTQNTSASNAVKTDAVDAGVEMIKPEIVTQEIIRPNTFIQAETSPQVIEPEVDEAPMYKIKQLEELSKDVLQDIPSLQLESHIYSTAEDFRSVVINGRSFKQGQFVSTDVVLEQITEDGIVINVGSQRIALPKGISWVASNAQ